MADITRIQGTHVGPTTDSNPNARPTDTRNTAAPAGGASFSELLRAKQGVASSAHAAPPSLNAVRFSAHAQTRLQSRQITLDASHLDRLQGAVQRAASKGSKDALVLMDDMAMVVSVTNRTVVTVVDRDNLKQNVFTNIDSAVIA